MRPAGEIRLALKDAAVVLSSGFTYRDLAMRAGVGYEAARQTVKNMVKAGEFQCVGFKPVEGAKRPLTVYRFAANSPTHADPFASLSAAWARAA